MQVDIVETVIFHRALRLIASLAWSTAVLIVHSHV